jgi:hypothetical protein
MPTLYGSTPGAREGRKETEAGWNLRALQGALGIYNMIKSGRRELGYWLYFRPNLKWGCKCGSRGY